MANKTITQDYVRDIVEKAMTANLHTYRVTTEQINEIVGTDYAMASTLGIILNDWGDKIKNNVLENCPHDNTEKNGNYEQCHICGATRTYYTNDDPDDISVFGKEGWKWTPWRFL